jgi:hypothetical protein
MSVYHTYVSLVPLLYILNPYYFCVQIYSYCSMSIWKNLTCCCNSFFRSNYLPTIVMALVLFIDIFPIFYCLSFSQTPMISRPILNQKPFFISCLNEVIQSSSWWPVVRNCFEQCCVFALPEFTPSIPQVRRIFPSIVISTIQLFYCDRRGSRRRHDMTSAVPALWRHFLVLLQIDCFHTGCSHSIKLHLLS